jgi:hypothetical protein
MVAVYELRGHDEYQSLESVNKSEYLRESRPGGSWNFDGTPVRDKWKALEMYVRQHLGTSEHIRL